MKAPHLANRHFQSHSRRRATVTFVVLMASACALPGQLVAESSQKIQKLSQECQSGKQKACSELAKIATEDKHAYLRQMAVEQLTDQATLARIAIEEKDVAIRSAAVIRLTDQPLLAKIAMEDKENQVQQYAALHLRDQALLAKLVLETTNKYVRDNALLGLTDQSLLASVLLKTTDDDVRNDCFRKLTSQAVLEQVAMNAQDNNLRIAAIQRLADQAILAKIVAVALDENVSIAAVRRLTDQAMLAKFAVEGDRTNVRIAAVAKLRDQSVLTKIAADDKEDSVRSAARRVLQHQQAWLAALRQAGLHIFEWPTDKDPVRKAADGTTNGALYLSTYGMVEAKFLNFTPTMASYLEGKDGLACVNGTQVSIDNFNKSLEGQTVIVFYLNIARTPQNIQDMATPQMALVKISDETPLPFVDPETMTRVNKSFWDAFLGSCQRINISAYIGSAR